MRAPATSLSSLVANRLKGWHEPSARARKWSCEMGKSLIRSSFSGPPNIHPRDGRECDSGVPVFLTASDSYALHTFLVHVHTFLVQCHEAAMTLLPPLDRADLLGNETPTLEVRTFKITLAAPASNFQQTDLPRQRKVIHSLDAQLKQVVKGATERYLKAAETLVSGLGTKPGVMRKPRARSNGNGKSVESFGGA